MHEHSVLQHQQNHLTIAANFAELPNAEECMSIDDDDWLVTPQELDELLDDWIYRLNKLLPAIYQNEDKPIFEFVKNLKLIQNDNWIGRLL